LKPSSAACAKNSITSSLTAPRLCRDDAATLAPRVDGTLFVVRNRYPAPELRAKPWNSFTSDRPRFSLVFNRANAASRSYYYYKYADYYPAARHA
jgi:hypothetical protein